MHVYDALALPAVRHLVIADLSMAIDASDLRSRGGSANDLVEQLDNFSAIACRQLGWNEHRFEEWTAHEEKRHKEGRYCQVWPPKVPAPEKGQGVDNDPHQAQSEEQYPGGVPVSPLQVRSPKAAGIDRQ
jgi:hypothetical protein